VKSVFNVLNDKMSTLLKNRPCPNIAHQWLNIHYAFILQFDVIWIKYVLITSPALSVPLLWQSG